jgi:hypothetical protein
MNSKKFLAAFSFFLMLAFSSTSFAQGLNWEGQTGAFLTPFAYTVASPDAKFGKPEVAFHYLNSGSVVGNDYQLSITEGVAKHFEFGYTSAFSSLGSSPDSEMFGRGFNEFHGKLKVVNENAFKTKWVPAIAVGSIGRIGEERVTWFAAGTGTPTNTNGDFYVVATKTVTQVKSLPFLLSFGEKVTNASILGIAGNAPHWQGRLFGAAAFVVKGPKSSLIFGSEALQQPRYVQGLGTTATIPTSLSYFVRAVPRIEGSPLQVDFAIAQVAGKIAPGVDLQARSQACMGVSYHF